MINFSPNDNHIYTDDELRNHVNIALRDEFITDINHLIKKRKRCYKASNIFEILGHLLLLITATISFINGCLNGSILSLISGTINIIGCACMRFSMYCKTKSKNENKILNKFLKSQKIDQIPHLGLEENINQNQNHNHNNSPI